MFPPSRHKPRRDGLPLGEVLIDEPVDEVCDAAFHLLRRVSDDAVFELTLHTRPVQQVHDSRDAQRVLEVLVAARFPLEEHLLDASRP
jgi:hypothetical protein